MCHSLSDESTCTATALGSWGDFPDLLPHDDVVATFKDKSKQMGKGKARADIVDVDMLDDV
jgi:hypothetical protein